MSQAKELFVLVVAADRTIAATLGTVLQAGGYMVGIAPSAATAARIAGRMVVDAAVIDLPAGQPLSFEAALILQNQYPACHIALVCSASQRNEAVMLAEDTGLHCEFVIRPLSRADLLSALSTAPGVYSLAQGSGWGELEAA
jgi:DNA-binding NtrC family response regulator